MDVMDKYARNAVRGAIAMMDAGAEEHSLLAYHFAVGLLLQTDKTGSATIPEIINHGISVLHGTAHAMADEGAIKLSDYANDRIVATKLACESSIRLFNGAR